LNLGLWKSAARDLQLTTRSFRASPGRDRPQLDIYPDIASGYAKPEYRQSAYPDIYPDIVSGYAWEPEKALLEALNT
jgi:hypothetical protein